MNFSSARHNMIDHQIRANRVHDPRLIAALSDIPREAFVPKQVRSIAYMDEPIPLGDTGRFLMEPLVISRLLQAAAITPLDVVLEIGCGTGYAAALLARLASTVVALECDPGLATAATEALTALEIDTVSVVEGPLAAGHPDQAPYDVIFFNGAINAVPEAVSAQLAEGGRLLAVLSDGGANRGRRRLGKGVLMTRQDGILSVGDLFECGTPALPGFAASSSFVF